VKSIKLPPSVTITDAKACAHQFREAFKESNSLTVDCSDLETCDVTLVQLLASAKKSAAMVGGCFALEHVNDELLTLLQRAGCVLADVTSPSGPN
jgi:anti-anti-sigma regulatory factor